MKIKNIIHPDEGKSDRVLLLLTSLLILIGLLMIASAGVFYSETRFADKYFFFKNQLFKGVLPGIIVLFICQRINYRFWSRVAVPLFLITVSLLILVLIPSVGLKVYGASRWLSLGPLSFQPSEMAKLSLILYLAAWLGSKGKEKVSDLYEGFVPVFLVLIGVGILIMKQPDTGTLGVVTLTALAIYFASGAKLKHLVGLLGIGLVGLIFLVLVEPYRMDRLTAFRNHNADPQGIGYQINQALVAIGSGGVFGLGLGHSRQKFNYLPEPVGDSIFAIIGEELGFLGSTVIAGLFLLFGLRGLRIAQRTPDPFGRFVVVGVTSWIVFQAFINIAAITGLIPLTGIPLPFISYGGTSLLFLMAGVGIVLNISKYATER